MYTSKIKTAGAVLSKEGGKVEGEPKLEVVEVVFKSDNRNYMRNLELLCEVNGYPCETTVEVTPRVVTFKGLTPTPAAEAKADAKADMRADDKAK